MMKRIISIALIATLGLSSIGPLSKSVQAKGNENSTPIKKYNKVQTWYDGDLRITLMQNGEKDVKSIVINTKTGAIIEGETEERQDGVGYKFNKLENGKKAATINISETQLRENSNIIPQESVMNTALTTQKVLSGGNYVIIPGDGGGGVGDLWDNVKYVFPSYSNNVDYMHPDKAYYGFGKNVSKTLYGTSNLHMQYSYESTYRLLGAGNAVATVLIGSLTLGLSGYWIAAIATAVAGFFFGTEIIEKLKDEDGCLWFVCSQNPTVLSKSYNGKLGKFIYHLQYNYTRLGPYVNYNVGCYTS